MDLEGREVRISASLGISINGEGLETAEDILRNADLAMRQARKHGMAGQEIYSQSMHERAVAAWSMEYDLRNALDRGELRLRYQPIVLLRTGGIAGFEALMRWQHPVRGLISPSEFIPLAEEMGLILSLGYWAIREACAQLAAWREEFPGSPEMTLSVNLYSGQFSEPGLVETLQGILEDFHLASHCLRLEITESMILEARPEVVHVMEQLRELGVRLDVDDFGTGYSSLSYLNRLPLDALKMDREFVARLKNGEKGAAMVKTIVFLAHQHNLQITAEGVETPDQWAKLREFDCDYGQGLFFSWPVDPDIAAAWIAAQPRW